MNYSENTLTVTEVLGIFFGALLLFHFDVAVAFARTIDTFMLDALAEHDADDAEHETAVAAE